MESSVSLWVMLICQMIRTSGGDSGSKSAGDCRKGLKFADCVTDTCG